MSQTDGYRYCRQYDTTQGPRWALWQRQAGTMRRVGTATTEHQANQFISHHDQRGASPMEKMDKSRMNTAIYRTTYLELKAIHDATDEDMIALMAEAVSDLSKKKLPAAKKALDRQADR